jgi:hypothetical protein
LKKKKNKKNEKEKEKEFYEINNEWINKREIKIQKQRDLIEKELTKSIEENKKPYLNKKSQKIIEDNKEYIGPIKGWHERILKFYEEKKKILKIVF